VTATLTVHPVLGTPLPPASVLVPRLERDWDWAGNSRRRRSLVGLVLRVKGRRCHLCGLPGATVADHLIPWAHGGRNVLENLEPAHYSCNSVRRDSHLADWFTRHPIRTRPALAPSRSWTR
jgi:5-methylcytosine-specific restriction endonuclease McrA